MTNILTCIIVDDNHLDRIAIETELNNFSQLKLLGSFANAIEAMEPISILQPSILFVDVNMPEISGLELFGNIDTYLPTCVVISAYPEYACQCFELKIFDYILKPLESHRFGHTIKRLEDFTQLKRKAGAYDVLFEYEFVIFKEGLSAVKLHTSQIIYLEAFGDYTKIVTEQKVHLTLATLSNFLESLPTGKFIRIHRSYVIAKNKVSCVNVKNVELGKHVLPIGKTYLKTAKQTFK